MACLSPFVPFVLVLAFQAWLWPFWHNHSIKPDYLRKRCHLCSVIELFTKVKRIIPEKITNRNPVQTQETVHELSRSGRNEASFKAKAKRPTTRNKTKRKKQRKSNACLRGHRKIVQTRKDYLLFLEIERKKRICNSQSSQSND